MAPRARTRFSLCLMPGAEDPAAGHLPTIPGIIPAAVGPPPTVRAGTANGNKPPRARQERARVSDHCAAPGPSLRGHRHHFRPGGRHRTHRRTSAPTDRKPLSALQSALLMTSSNRSRSKLSMAALDFRPILGLGSSNIQALNGGTVGHGNRPLSSPISHGCALTLPCKLGPDDLYHPATRNLTLELSELRRILMTGSVIVHRPKQQSQQRRDRPQGYAGG